MGSVNFSVAACKWMFLFRALSRRRRVDMRVSLVLKKKFYCQTLLTYSKSVKGKTVVLVVQIPFREVYIVGIQIMFLQCHTRVAYITCKVYFSKCVLSM